MPLYEYRCTQCSRQSRCWQKTQTEIAGCLQWSHRGWLMPCVDQYIPGRWGALQGVRISVRMIQSALEACCNSPMDTRCLMVYKRVNH